MQSSLNTLTDGELTTGQAAHSLMGWLCLLEDSQSGQTELKVDKRAQFWGHRPSSKLSSVCLSCVTLDEPLILSEP